jgi:lipopolysaccharide export system ATP-binding protein
MPIVEIEQALEHFKRGDPASAVPVLREVVTLVPTYVMAHVLLAQAYEALQQDEEAADSWRRVQRLIPLSPPGTVLPSLEDSDPDFVHFAERLRAADRAAAAASGSRVHLAEDAAVLRAEDLVKRYRKRSVVRAVTLEVRQGEIVGLLGPNGAGKTTTFYMIMGLARPDRGRVYLDDADLTKLPMYERARRGIGYLAQEASIFGNLTVEQNLEAVLEYQGLAKAERTARADALIGEFGLERVRRSKGYMLSGGERRRTEIARALAARPKFFLLDEPFAGVDPIAVEDIQAIVAGLKARGIGVLITDHNVHETLAITDRAYLLYEGRILKAGTAEALATDPEVRKRYLGEKFTLERYR